MWTLLTAVAACALVDALVWRRRFARAIDRPPPPRKRPDAYPSISVIRPVRGVDVGQGDNLRAALDTGYPGEIETLFVFDDQEDPGLPQARAVVLAHRGSGTARIEIAGPPPPGRTGKLQAMEHGVRRARHTLIAFGDSDTRPDREVLRALVETLLSAPDVGCAFAPVVVVGPLRTAGDVGYGLLINSLYGPAVARAAGRRGNLPFIMGQLMVWRREALDAIGGVACAEGQLVDDMYLGNRLSRAGYRNVMIKHPLPIVTGGQRFGEFIRTYRRWLLFGQNGLPLAFTWPLWLWAAGWLGSFALAWIGLVRGPHWALFCVAASAFLAHGLAAAHLQRRLGGPAVPLRHAWMLWGVILVAPIVVISTLWRGVEWRGRRYQLGSEAAIGPTRNELS